MKKIALLTTVLLASTAAMAAPVSNNCATSNCSVKLNGTEIAKGASADAKAGDTLTINGKATKISAAQAAPTQAWEVDAKGELKSAKAGASAEKAATPSAQPASAPAAAPVAPATGKSSY